MTTFRILLLASMTALVGCSWFNKQPKSSARTYDGDESPHIRMYEESPGSPLNN
jgi:hypothetical protein